MKKSVMVETILTHYNQLVSNYHELEKSVDWDDEWSVANYNDAETVCLHMEELLIKLEIAFVSIYGQVYKDGKLVITE